MIVDLRLNVLLRTGGLPESVVAALDSEFWFRQGRYDLAVLEAAKGGHFRTVPLPRPLADEIMDDYFRPLREEAERLDDGLCGSFG